MADGIGLLRIERDRKFEDYRSLKQYFRNHNLEEIIYEGYQVSTATLVEMQELGGQTLTYLSAEATVYVRSESDAAGARDKSITITYLDNSGVVQTATASTNDTDSTTEVEIATDFQNLRSMVCAVEGLTNNGFILCNSDNTAKYGFIQDGRMHSIFSRYYVPAAVSGQNTKYFLGRVKCNAQTGNEGAAADKEQGYQLSVTFTPKDLVDMTMLINFDTHLDWQPCIELEPQTSVIVKIKKILDQSHNEVHVQTTMLEVDRISN